ncbi:hypothetical protein [Chimaeribacter arupi]|uniref:hypothetical protein n=1 Tax=Chimaeribacter arupi TaxID=2060066 RepID=UPI0011AF4B8B|nr:hypothetical protein [Chimaeribacter arupi]
MNPLKWLLTKETKEPTVTDAAVTDTATTAQAIPPVTTTTETVVPATTQTTTTSVTSDDAVLGKVKELLISIGHDVENEFDEVVALAKKLVAKA